TLLAGAVLIAAPIVLHLVMRRRPEQLVFPALRFVRNRRAVNQTRLRLRHLLLLLLRCAAIALLAFALARPLWTSGAQSGAAQQAGLAVVIDNSPRMTYLSENKTRLEAALEHADWLVARLPAERQLVVSDLATSRGGRLMDRDAALLRIARTRPAMDARPIDKALRSTLASLNESNPERQEVYLLTDGSQGALPEAVLQGMARVMEDYPAAKLTLFDVGVSRPVNRGLAPLRLSGTSLAEGQTLSLSTALTSTGAAPDKPVPVELVLKGELEEEKRGEQLVALDATGARKEIEFSIGSLPRGVHQGCVRLGGGDPLPVDDTQYFTVSVAPPRRVLIVAPTPTAAVFVQEALAPSAAGADQSYRVDVARYDERWPAQLAEHRAVFLLDPPPLLAADWRTLANYVSRGGSACIALGRAAELDAFNSAEAQQLLPAPLKWKSRDETYLRPRVYNHPALVNLAELADALPWSEFPVFNYWGLGQLDPSAVEVAPFANGDPAIVERAIDQGRVLTITTPFSDEASQQPWNLLPTGIDPWPFLALVDNLAAYLTGASDTRLNYRPGELVTLPLGEQNDLTGYVLTLPSGDAVRQTIAPGDTSLSIGMTQQLGNYRVRAGGESGGLDLGFSVSPDQTSGQIEHQKEEALAAALPVDRFQVARSRDALSDQIILAGQGRELFPWVITLVAAALAAETWMANRFYEREKEAGGRG
ncbi:MAG: BatA and WFA domain-containing protein, partial [Planctomycetales bacterium]|nr:BatA and WFA domain-containing protein [Planctomycetales bacterium]